MTNIRRLGVIALLVFLGGAAWLLRTGSRAARPAEPSASVGREVARPVRGHKLADPAGWMGADPDAHVGEVVDRVDAGDATGLGERGDDGGAAAAHAVGEQPVLPTDCDRPDRALAGVVVDRDPTVLEEATQGAVLVAQVADAVRHDAGVAELAAVAPRECEDVE